MVPLHFIHLDNHFIYSQLELEEALLRSDNRNWCLFNYGSPPAVVMGISGKPHLLLETQKLLSYQIPVIRRFSGGGTVLVDPNTLFVSFIFNRDTFGFLPQPENIMNWSAKFYAKVFTQPQFQLRENDYVYANRKFGGNAQYIRKDRWLHHTSFLWDYDPMLMQLLKLPLKTPQYRDKRDHADFLCTLKDHFNSKEEIVISIQKALSQHFDLRLHPLQDIQEILQKNHRKATTFLSKADLLIQK